MKLTIDKFKKKNVIIRNRKQDKIPEKCLDCYWLGVFKNIEINRYYYFCSQIN